MFGLKRAHDADKTDLNLLKEELRKSRQEREAARLGLVTAVRRLMREAQAFPLDMQIEKVAKDLTGSHEDERS